MKVLNSYKICLSKKTGILCGFYKFLNVLFEIAQQVNLGVSVVFLLSLYSYTKGMRMFSLGLAMALLIEIGIRGFIEQKFAQEGAEVNGNKIYHVSEILRYACAIILAIAVWRNGFK